MRIPSVFMRGGTSKALFFHRADLPDDAKERDALILGIYGSPDPYGRQLDGIGGATSSTSKVAVIGDGRDLGVDVTYEFGQVSIGSPLIDRRGNCGNISSAVGPFAVDEGLVEASEPVTTVRFRNTNTDKVIVAHVPVRDGRFDPRGEYRIPGVAAAGAQIRMDYLDPGGAVTGRLLPTGNATDDLDVPGLGKVTVSLVDAANPLVFVRWEDLGLTGDEEAGEIDNDHEMLGRIETVRARAGVLAGIAATPEEITADAPSVPKLCLVGPPRAYESRNGQIIGEGATSLRASMMSMGRLHSSLPLTGGICTTVAASITGTVVNTVSAPRPNGKVQIGHPAGILELTARPYTDADGTWTVDAVSVYRTARRLFEGAVFAPQG